MRIAERVRKRAAYCASLAAPPAVSAGALLQNPVFAALVFAMLFTGYFVITR